MPPRRSARMADVAERVVTARSARIVAAGEHAAPALAPLPHALVLHILSLLPVDCRLLCAGVCRSWRAALEDASLWLRLDLSASAHGVGPRGATAALLRAATGRARGALQALDIMSGERIPFDVLLAVVTANSAALRELYVWHVAWPHGVDDVAYSLPVDALEALLRAAPGLEYVEADVTCRDTGAACRVLRKEPPFGPLWLDCLVFEAGEAEPAEADVLALAADLALHVSLGRLELDCTLGTVAALDAVVRAALRRRLRSIRFVACGLSPAYAPALARLVAGPALKHLNIEGNGCVLLDADAAHVLGDALRVSTTLVALYLRAVDMWHAPGAVAAGLLHQLVGHPSLRSLDVAENPVGGFEPAAAGHAAAGRAAAGAALAALVAANAPALEELDVSWCDLGGAGLHPLFRALRANTHLRTLNCRLNDLTDAFARTRLLPAVRANTSLRELTTGLRFDAAHEAEALVRRRGADAAE
jgi:hypothetical protein